WGLTRCGVAGVGLGLGGSGIAEQRAAFLGAEAGALAGGFAQCVGASGLWLRGTDGVGGDRPHRPSPGYGTQDDLVAAQAHQVAVIQPRLNVVSLVDGVFGGESEVDLVAGVGVDRLV